MVETLLGRLFLVTGILPFDSFLRGSNQLAIKSKRNPMEGRVEACINRALPSLVVGVGLVDDRLAGVRGGTGPEHIPVEEGLKNAFLPGVGVWTDLQLVVLSLNLIHGRIGVFLSVETLDE